MRAALRRAAIAGGALLLAASCAWGLGFAWFALAARQPGEPPPRADGIVALTGGPDRIETALALLAADRAPVLLVSGVARGVDVAEVARRGPLDPAALAGHLAGDGVHVSVRGTSVRVSAHRFNDDGDVDRLLRSLSTAVAARG